MLRRLRPARIKASIRYRYRRRLRSLPGWAFPPVSGERLRSAFISDVFSEWALLYPPRLDKSSASPELVHLLCAASSRALDISLSDVARRASRDWERQEVPAWPGEHYRLLAALAEVTGSQRVVEVGTFTGASALSFLTVAGVEQVVTYDVVPWNEVPSTMLRTADFGPRLEQRLVRLDDGSVFSQEAETLRCADLVFVDGPKDCEFEYRFLPRLLALAPKRTQLVVLDDVRVMPMVNLWRSMPLPKLDAASLGHWSGTGLVLRDGPVDWTPPPASGDVERHHRSVR